MRPNLDARLPTRVHPPDAVASGQRHLGRVTLAASFGFALVQLDVTIINVALPQIADALDAGMASLQWLVDAYALTFAVLLLSGGALADRFGARRVYLGGLGAFALASLLCGLAPDVSTLIAARALQGATAAAMLPSSLSLLNHATSHDPALRARAVGAWTAAGSVTIAAGPIVGGLLLAAGSFRGIFLVNLPLCALAAWLTARVPDEAPLPARARSFDWPGQLLAIVALAALTTAVIAARPLGLAHPRVLLGAAIAVVAGALFVKVEAQTRAPMLPLSLFRAPNFTPAVLYGITVNLTYYGVVFVLSLYLQRVRGYSALEAGLAYLPLTASFFGVNLLSGRLVGRIGARWPMVIGAAVDACGFALLLVLTAVSPYAHMLPAFALIPLGMGLGVPAMTTAVLSSVDKASSGIAAGVLNAARQAAGAIGVAMFGALCGDGHGGVVTGLHTAAAIALTLLLGASLMALARVRGRRPAH